MSLRKAPELTPELLAAARQNAQHSTGPRSPAAKRNSKLNALKHGAYVSDENQRQAMLALGEDPAQFDSLKQELMTSFGPGDALWERQVDDLARLYWRRERVERAQEGLMRRALQGIEEWQHRRQQEMARVTFPASQHELLDWNLPLPSDREVRLRETLSYLEVIREEVRQGVYRPRQQTVVESLYRGEEGWRSMLIHALLFRFCQAEELARNDPDQKHYVEYLRATGTYPEPPGEGKQQELLRLLGEEIASVEEELAYAERQNEERAAIERDACLAPQGETWNMLVRQEGSLDRSIDRKVRILLALRKESASLAAAPAGEDGGGKSESIEEAVDSTPENAQLVEAVANKKVKERPANVTENKGPALSSPGPSGNVIENKDSYAHSAGMLLEIKDVDGRWGKSGRQEQDSVVVNLLSRRRNLSRSYRDAAIWRGELAATTPS